MLGRMLKKIRLDKGLTQAHVCEFVDIDHGHYIHIEKEQRNPSHKTLQAICKSLNTPYQPVSYLFDRTVTQEHLDYNIFDHISYDKIIAVESFDSFITCPASCPNAAIAIRVQNDEMAPYLKKGDYGYLELNTPLDSGDIALIKLNETIYIRQFLVRANGLVLRAKNKKYPDINFTKDDDFVIYGRIKNNKGK